MELFTNTIYFFRKLNSINLFFTFSNIKINNKIKNLVVVVVVETVEILSEKPFSLNCREIKQVENIFFMLIDFLFV